MSSMTGNSDPYLYPGTNVLKNLRGLTDPKELARFEARRTHRRIAKLIDTPMPGPSRRTSVRLQLLHYLPFDLVFSLGRKAGFRSLTSETLLRLRVQWN